MTNQLLDPVTAFGIACAICGVFVLAWNIFDVWRNGLHAPEQTRRAQALAAFGLTEDDVDEGDDVANLMFGYGERDEK